MTHNKAGILVLNIDPDSHFCPCCVDQAQNWFWNLLKKNLPSIANPWKLFRNAVLRVGYILFHFLIFCLFPFSILFWALSFCVFALLFISVAGIDSWKLELGVPSWWRGSYCLHHFSSINTLILIDYPHIQPSVDDKYPVFPWFCRKLARTKTQQSTDKASKYNGRKVFSRVSIDGVNFVFYPLSSINFNSSLFAANSRDRTLLYREIGGRYKTGQ